MVSFASECTISLANERVISIFVLNCLLERHLVSVNYVLYRIHVPIKIQPQSDPLSLSNKDGTVIQDSFGHVMASCLTILEVTIDNSCPNSRDHLGSINVDFIMGPWASWYSRDLVRVSWIIIYLLPRSINYTWSNSVLVCVCVCACMCVCVWVGG